MLNNTNRDVVYMHMHTKWQCSVVLVQALSDWETTKVAELYLDDLGVEDPLWFANITNPVDSILELRVERWVRVR